MATRAIAASGEKIVNTETYVSSALSLPVQVFLPKINDGSSGSVAVDTEIRIETTAGGSVELLTLDGRRVGMVDGRTQAVVVAQSGTAQGEADRWHLRIAPQTPVAFGAQLATTAATNSSPYGFSQAQADGLIARVNAMLTCLIDNGLMKAE